MKRPNIKGWSVAIIALASTASPAFAQSGATERVSVTSDGAEANNSSDMSAISADGHFVAFVSLATNLVPGDTNDAADVFVHDRRTGTTERVSVDSRGRQGDGNSGFFGVGATPAISADGRFVAFHSEATNLVPKDTNNSIDVFVRDRLAGTTERVSLSSTGGQSVGFSHAPSISADGRFVSFQSDDMSLVPIETDVLFLDQIYVRDRRAGTTERSSVNSAGDVANASSFFADLSADGRFVVFSSSADNLAPGDNQFAIQVFLRDRTLGTTERVSQDAAGNGGDGTSIAAVVSADGRFVVFESNAANLVPSGNHENHVYVRDRQASTTERVSEDSAGDAADLSSGQPDITADGRFVAFYSLATNLVPADTNNRRDIFVRDRQSGAIERVSVSSDGEQGNSESMLPRIADDGLAVAFESSADNLVPEDTGATPDIFVNDRRPAADLALAQTDSPDPVRLRTALTYTLTVVNNGSADATEVVLTDLLPGDARFVSATSSQGRCVRTGSGPRNGLLTCDLGVLASGAGASVSIVVEPVRVGTLINTATVMARQPDPNRADNRATAMTTVF